MDPKIKILNSKELSFEGGKMIIHKAYEKDGLWYDWVVSHESSLDFWSERSDRFEMIKKVEQVWFACSKFFKDPENMTIDQDLFIIDSNLKTSVTIDDLNMSTVGELLEYLKNSLLPGTEFAQGSIDEDDEKKAEPDDEEIDMSVADEEDDATPVEDLVDDSPYASEMDEDDFPEVPDPLPYYFTGEIFKGLEPLLKERLEARKRGNEFPFDIDKTIQLDHLIKCPSKLKKETRRILLQKFKNLFVNPKQGLDLIEFLRDFFGDEKRDVIQYFIYFLDGLCPISENINIHRTKYRNAILSLIS